MSNYSISIKNSAKSNLKKIQKSQLKSQFLKIVEILKIDPQLSTLKFIVKLFHYTETHTC